MTRPVGRNEVVPSVGRAFASLAAIASVGISLTSCLWSSDKRFPNLYPSERR